MKKFLVKSFNVLTILSLVFMSNVALATPNEITFCHVPPGNEGNPQTLTTSINAWENAHDSGTGEHENDYLGPCEGDEDNEEVCESQVLVSEEGDGMVPLTYEHVAWTASIDGAEWVWSEDGISDPVGETTETFARTFTLVGTPTNASLEIATDNEYVVTVNGDYVISDLSEDNYSSTGQDSHTIPAAELVSGENTIEFEVTNWAQVDGTPESNPAGLMYKLEVNCTPSEDEDDDCDEEDLFRGGDEEENDDCDDQDDASCEEGNLIENGGFELPDVTNGSGWQLFPEGTTDLGWDVSWVDPDGNEPSPANLELHGGVNGWLPSEGAQYAELDTDYGSPAGGAASVEISQTINTIDGQMYDISYAFSPRPNTPLGENELEVLVDGNVVQTQGPVAGVANTSWNTYTVSFEGNGDSMTISFKDVGTPNNSVGTFLDDVSVNCGDEPEEEEGPSCESNEIWARVVVSSFSNVGNGDLTDTIYLGSSVNTVASGEWFNTAILDAGSIEDFADVEGLAVIRKAGKIILELHGSHNPQGVGQEYADGFIELFNGVPTTLVGATGQNKLEGVSDGGHEDLVWITGDRSNFNLGVGTADDRYTTNFTYQEDETCDDEEENDSINLIAQKIVCEEESMLPNWGLGGDNITSTTASDWVTEHVGCDLVEGWQFEWALYNTANPGDNVTGPIGGDWNAFTSSVNIPMPEGTEDDTKLWVREVTQEGYIPFEGADNESDVSAEVYCHSDVLNYDNYERLDGITADGTYNCVAWNVLEEPTEPSCEETQTCEPEECTENCEQECTENCEENTPNDNGGGSSGGSSRRGGGGSSGGQVLGAETEAFCDFTIDTYMRLGYKNNPEQVKTLQWLLNKYVAPVPSLPIDGYYGLTTEAAVKAFQLKYKDKILTPWNLTMPTGIFFRTTLTQAKNLECPEEILPVPSNLIPWSASTTVVPPRA